MGNPALTTPATKGGYVGGTPVPNDQPPPPDPAFLAAQHAAIQDQINQNGENVGTSGWTDPRGVQTSQMRFDQSNLERVEQQQEHYMYGGYAGGANDAIAAARGSVGPYAQNLGMYGGQFFGQAVEGANTMGQGVGGLYGTANALNQYAQQGPGPSVAQAQLDANTANAMRQQLALAGSGRGQGGGASAFRQAAANQAQIQGAANAQTAMLQAQEAQNWRQAQLAAYGQAGALYGQGAGLGSDYAQGMAGLASGAQQGAGTLGLSGEQLAHQIQGTALSGSEAYEGNLTQTYGIDKGVPVVDSGGLSLKEGLGLGLQTLGVVGGFAAGGPAGGAAGGAAGTATAEAIKNSDIRSKTNVAPASALNAIGDAGSYSYNYLDPQRHGEGTYVGPMAQELERAPGVVVEQPDGSKAIDTPRLTTLNTSAIAELNKKVDKLAGGGEFDAAPSAATQTALHSFQTAPTDAQIAKKREEIRASNGSQTADEFERYAMGLRPAATKRAGVDLNAGPQLPGVNDALRSFASTPTDGQIAQKREALRALYGSGAANEFEQYAMALKNGPRVSIGQAQVEQPARYTAEIGPATIERPVTAARPAPAGTTQPIVYSGDPGRLEYERGRYGDSVYGAPAPAPAAESEPLTGKSLLDSIFGPSVGQQASDIADEEYRNSQLRALFRQPPREDMAL